MVIVADDGASASYVASDLLAQAEHSEDASAILLTTSNALALEVVRELEIQTGTLSRAELIEELRREGGDIVLTEEIWRDPHVQTLLDKRRHECEPFDCVLRGLSGTRTVYRISTR